MINESSNAKVTGIDARIRTKVLIVISLTISVTSGTSDSYLL